MSGGLAIFAKTPGLTPAKTRLAAEIGREAADAFYRLALEAVEESVAGFLAAHPDWTACWAVAEAEGTADPRWRRFGARHTGEGGLGRRMAQVYDALRQAHGRALLIGTDSPQLTPGHLESAAAALAQADVILGPAEDGGFWLVGGRRRIPTNVWQVPRYGTAQAMADFEGSLSAAGLGMPERLTRLQDVDEAGDLAGLAASMPAAPSPAQRRLAEWLTTLPAAVLGAGPRRG